MVRITPRDIDVGVAPPHTPFQLYYRTAREQASEIAKHSQPIVLENCGDNNNPAGHWSLPLPADVQGDKCKWQMYVCSIKIPVHKLVGYLVLRDVF